MVRRTQDKNTLAESLNQLKRFGKPWKCEVYEHVRSINALISPSSCRAGIRVACMSITSKEICSHQRQLEDIGCNERRDDGFTASDRI